MADFIQLENGLVVPAKFAEAPQRTKPKAPDMRPIATTQDGRDITRGYVSPLLLLWPEDEVLRLRGNGNYEIYREVLRDDQVHAVFQQRRLALTSREWEVLPGGKLRQDKKAADFIREQLNVIKWDAVTDKMLYGVFYGYAVAEAMWARDGSRIVMPEVRVRDRRRFKYDGANRLRLLTMNNAMPGELLPDRKFWQFCVGADHDDEPYGLGLAHWLYWPVFFKRNGIKFWMIFLEKFGQPTVKGTYPSGATPDEKAKLLSAIEAVSTDSGMIMPEGMAVELIEAARSGTADYTSLYDRMNDAIAKVVLGQTLTSEAKGGQYRGEIQMEVRQDIVKADGDIINDSFNGTIVRWLTDWNFPGAAYPKVWRRMDDAPDLSKNSQTDKTLFDMGFRPSMKRIEDVYGADYEDTGAPAPPSQGTAAPPPTGAAPPPAFAEVTGTDIPGEQANRLAAESDQANLAMIERIRGIVDQAKDLPDLQRRLEAAFAEADATALGRVMRLALSAAHLAGRYDVLNSAGGN